MHTRPLIIQFIFNLTEENIMADYYVKTLTNYFSVTDEEKYKRTIAGCDATANIEIVTRDHEDGTVKYGFYCNGSIWGLFEEGTEDPNYDLFCESLQQIIPEGEAVIITEAGWKAMRYLVANSTIITHKEIKIVNLDDEITKIAAEMLDEPDYNPQY